MGNCWLIRLVITILTLAGCLASAIAASAMPVPAGQEFFQYAAVANPDNSSLAATAHPLGVGAVATGGDSVTLTVGLDHFSEPVDIYLGIYLPFLSEDIFLITEAGGVQPASAGLAKWRSGVTGGTDGAVFGNIPKDMLPVGEYIFYVLVTPANRLDHYYLWSTEFLITVPDKTITDALDMVVPQLNALLKAAALPAPETVAQTLAAVPNVNVLTTGPDKSVWAEIGTNGPLIVIQTVPTPSSTAAEDLGTQATELKRATSGDNKSLPTGKKILLLSGLDGFYSYRSPVKNLRDIILAGDKGYTAGDIISEPATLDRLRAVQGADVFFFKAHGLAGEVVTMANSSQTSKSFALTSSDRVDLSEQILSFQFWQNLPADLRMDINTRRVAFALVTTDLIPPDWKRQDEWVYAVTSEFAREYWSFNRDSFVMLNACQSAKQPVATAIQDAVKGKGASVVAGWSSSVDNACADKAARFLFDRLIGANSDPSAKKTPPVRPFDFRSIESEMSSMKPPLNICNQGTDLEVTEGLAHLEFGTNAPKGDFGILTPSIKNMLVREGDGNRIPQGTLTIEGTFGTKQGAVSVGGTPVTVSQWSDSEITCDLSDPTLAGDVVVEVEGRKSNPVPLTEWHGTFTFTKKDGGRTTKFTFKLHMRADIHSYREKSGGEVIKPSMKPLAIDWYKMQYIAKDSSASYECTGSGSSGTWAGGASIPVYLYPQNFPSQYLTGRMFFDMESNTMYIQFLGVGECSEGHNSTVSVTGHDMGDSAADYFMPLQLDSGFNMAGGKIVDVSTNSTLEWTGVAANPATIPDHDKNKLTAASAVRP